MLPVLASAWKLIVVQRQDAECLIRVKYLVTHTVGLLHGTCDGTMTSHLPARGGHRQTPTPPMRGMPRQSYFTSDDLAPCKQM